jgi:hypothetical protein
MRANWYRGNLHTHTTQSDGDAPPDVVATWYASHGYDFLALTDHNVLTPPSLVPSLGLVLLPGEEITMALDVHVNGLGLRHSVEPPAVRAGLTTGEAKLALLRDGLAAVDAQGALASVNHPNYQWALDFDILRGLPALRFMEIFNGHPLVHNDGTGAHDGVERLWDRLLTEGRSVWGLATDDAHHYHDYSPMYANPGRGWVYTRAEKCTPQLLLEALSVGDFYASTGVRLAQYQVSNGVIDIVADVASDQAACIELIGSHGRVLEAQTGVEASFRVPSTMPYVRAKVTCPDGTKAWLQPVFSSPS